MSLYRDEGIVLRTTKLGEADRIITLFTKHHGKVRSVAKGVRRTKSRFGGRLEPFMHVDLLLNEGRTFDVVSQAQSITAYAQPITQYWPSFLAANVIVETCNDILTTEHEPAQSQYQLLLGALHTLAYHRHEPSAIAASYVMRSLAFAGWTPRLDMCVVCGTHEGLSYFSPSSGGVMCAQDHTPDSRKISEFELNQLRALVLGDWQTLDQAPVNPNTIRTVQRWAQFYLERPIRSLDML